jgi:RNA polymerase sigma-70 factor, ECF subfamily
MRAPAPRPDSEETLRLLDLAGQGDKHAIDLLLQKHRAPLRAFVDRYMDPRVRGRLDPSDLVQEAQLVIARRLPDFLARRPMSFDLWMRKTARERLHNAHRDHRAQRRDVNREAPQQDESSVALAEQLIASDPSPSKVVEARERSAQIAAIVADLPEGDREILLMRLLDKMPYDEIATLWDVTVAAARQRFVRAMDKFAKVLSGRGLLGDAP